MICTHPAQLKNLEVSSTFPDNFFINLVKLGKQTVQFRQFCVVYHNNKTSTNCFQHCIETYSLRKRHVSVTTSQLPASYVLDGHIIGCFISFCVCNILYIFCISLLQMKTQCTYRFKRDFIQLTRVVFYHLYTVQAELCAFQYHSFCQCDPQIFMQ